MTAVIEARGVSKQFLLKHEVSLELTVRFLGLLSPRHRQSVEEFWALRNVSLQISRGEAVGLIGRNGSGKSTFLKLIAAIHRPTTGRMLVARDSRISSMIELGVGFHPELTGRENVFLNAAIHGLTGQETEAIYGDIVSYSGLEHFIDVPIKNYSSGMYMRLGFAIAANLDPDILLLDEIFAVGDADFQQRCVETLKKFMERGKTIIFVSHAPAAVRTMCRRTCVLDHGELVFDGEVERGLAFYERLLGLEHGAPAPPVAPSQPIENDPGAMLAPPPRSNGNGALGDEWTLDFLRQQGLDAHHRLLQVGGTVLGERSATCLDRTNYVWVTGADGLFELGDEAGAFDFAVALSAFPALPFNRVARCIAGVVRRLRPGGRFYVTWFENPDPASFDPIVQASGVTTYPDHEPYHYPLALVASCV